jgi:hypothetical protein
MSKQNKPKKQTKPAEQPKKDIKSEDSAYHPEKGAYVDQELKADHDAEEKHLERENQEFFDDLKQRIESNEDEPDLKGSRSITTERWHEAQVAEVEAHNNDQRNTAQHYAETYKTYFKYVGLGTDLQGLNVIEIGPAMHSALAICTNFGKVLILEPIHSEELFSFVRNQGIPLIDEPLESISDEQLLSVRENVKGPLEVWLFNVLQHVIDPDKFIGKCKLVADRIRFFEPVNTPIAPHHPHSYTDGDYIKWFGIDVCKLYFGGTEPNFHTADCVYGVWIKE